MSERPTEALGDLRESEWSGRGSILAYIVDLEAERDEISYDPAAGGHYKAVTPAHHAFHHSNCKWHESIEARVEELERALGEREAILHGWHTTHAYKDPRSMADSFADCPETLCVRFRAALSKQEPPQEDDEDYVYDVNKCSWCVHGNHARCHGPCNCEHPEQEPRGPCAICGGSGEVPWVSRPHEMRPCPDCVPTPNTPEVKE